MPIDAPHLEFHLASPSPPRFNANAEYKISKNINFVFGSNIISKTKCLILWLYTCEYSS